MRMAATMGTWKTRKIAKKSRGRSETGRSKGLIATPIQKFMCRNSRSYKHPLYEEVMKSLGVRKNKK